MLKKLRIQNCLSFVDFTIEFDKINLLVGKNASGKTNLCHILQFIRLSRDVNNLSDAFQRSMGKGALFPNFKTGNNDSSFFLECELSDNGKKILYKYELSVRFHESIDALQEIELLQEKLIIKKYNTFNDIVLLKNKGGKAKILRESSLKNSSNKKDYLSEEISKNKTMLREIVDSKEHELSNRFKSFLNYIVHFDFQNEHLKEVQIRYPHPFLEGRGENLFRAIYYLKRNNPKLFRRYINEIKKVESNINSIVFFESLTDQKIYLPTFMKNDGLPLYLDSISSGTLRAMGILMLPIWSEILDKDHKVQPVFTIEEPDNGIHVGLLKMIYETVKSSPGQFIFTTHSPYMIDLFDDNLDGIKVLDKKDDETVLLKLDKKKIKRLLEKMPLGELHFREILA